MRGCSNLRTLNSIPQDEHLSLVPTIPGYYMEKFKFSRIENLNAQYAEEGHISQSIGSSENRHILNSTYLPTSNTSKAPKVGLQFAA